MKTKANQSAAEKNITMVALADIQPSGFNPRKRFDEAALYELAESIKRQGVLQPITVRPVDGTDRYGIVFGERRYRASVIAGRDEIPAIVTELSDEEAEEMAITENLQRKDVTPVEEAAAYQRLIESGRHTVQTLAQLFGKNENYIRTRLKFTALIPEIAALLEADELTISVAAEICRYGEDIQREVYEKHLQDEGTYNSWRGLKAADVARRIEQNFTTDLQYYRFDKTECATCAHNTNNLLLFRCQAVIDILVDTEEQTVIDCIPHGAVWLNLLHTCRIDCRKWVFLAFYSILLQSRISFRPVHVRCICAPSLIALHEQVASCNTDL